MMTNEQLADAVALIAELDAKRPAIDLNTAEIHEDGLTYECPLCQGEGYVDGHQYINVSDKAINVFFSGIGSEFVDARRFFDAAPLMAQIIRQLWAEREIMKAKISKYESDHPWAKYLQDMAESAVKENYTLRAVMEQARETLAFYGSWSDSDAAHPVRQALAQLDAALGSQKCERSQSELSKQTDGLGRV